MLCAISESGPPSFMCHLQSDLRTPRLRVRPCGDRTTSKVHPGEHFYDTYAACTVYTIYTVYTIFTVYTVFTVYTNYTVCTAYTLYSAYTVYIASTARIVSTAYFV